MKARQDAEQAAADLKAQKEAARQQKARAAAEAAQAKVKPAAEPVVTAPAPSADTEAQARAREALARELNQPVPAGQVATVSVKPAAVKPVKPTVAEPVKPVEVNYPGKDLGMKPIAAPALPIAASKEEQLQALLAKYKADQLSPEEYHKQRADILAAP